MYAWRALSLVAVAGVLIVSLPAGQPVTAASSGGEHGLTKGQELPTGQRITPTAAPGAQFHALDPDLPPPLDGFVAGHAVATALSPDQKTLLILTSGFNSNYLVSVGSSEYVFVYDVSRGVPVKRQVLQLPNTFNGIAWNPDGSEFYVSGGADDNVHVFELQAGAWVATTPITLGHADAPGLGVGPVAAGLAVNARGDRLVVANMYNDSISLIDIPGRAKLHELDLRPGKIDPARVGVPGGQYPFWVAIRGDDKAYVSSMRDRELVVVDLAASPPTVVKRIAVRGQPNKMLLTRDGSRLYAALDNRDAVAVIDTRHDRVLDEIPTTAPRETFANHRKLRGSNPNSLALSPDEKTLFVTNGGTNCVAVVRLGKGGGSKSRVVGLIPTGWYPNSVSVRHGMLYVVNAKSPAGPNSGLYDADQYVLQLLKAGLLTLPVPGDSELEKLTRQVASNNNFDDERRESAKLAFLRQKIRHVIYIVKENRTYDQVLGDLEHGNGDPSLTMFPEPITPNHHQLARRFVTLDNFYQSGAVSADGWNWAVAARTTDFTEKTVPVNYAGRGFAYDWQGQNRNLNTAHGTVAERRAANPLVPDDPDILPGTADIAAPDSGDGDAGEGYLWDSALRAGLSLRHYGMYTDWNLYYSPPPTFIPLSRTPFADGIVQAYTTNPRLKPHTDVYYRGYDMKLPDYWLFKEWEREFDRFVRHRNLPRLTMMALPHDHFGDFGEAIDGVDTPDTQMADNDYALGRIVEKLARSPYRHNTLVFVTEDDSQDGPDHVDAQRTVGYVIGPYVKQGALVSTRYTTVSMLRTIEEILGIEPLGLYDGLTRPMTDVFDLREKHWSYTAVVPDVLRTTALPLPPATADNSLPATARAAAYAKPRKDAAWWTERTRELDFTQRDNPRNTERFNRILWSGLMGEHVPYPLVRHARDLSQDRRALLAAVE